jgi:hypothetical protein
VTLSEPQGEQRPTVDIRVIGGNPSAEEIAATTAVLTAVLEELAEENGRVSAAGPSAWQRSQRGLREPLTPGNGAWRSFSA